MAAGSVPEGCALPVSGTSSGAATCSRAPGPDGLSLAAVVGSAPAPELRAVGGVAGAALAAPSAEGDAAAEADGRELPAGASDSDVPDPPGDSVTAVAAAASLLFGAAGEDSCRGSAPARCGEAAPAAVAADGDALAADGPGAATACAVPAPAPPPAHFALKLPLPTSSTTTSGGGGAGTVVLTGTAALLLSTGTFTLRS